MLDITPDRDPFASIMIEVRLQLQSIGRAAAL